MKKVSNILKYLIGFFMLTMTHAYAEVVQKSNNDKRDYAYTQLDNGLKLLVISDKDVQRAAAAVDIAVGSSANPDDFLGLAHFLEHMLFLGTDKYPDPDDYINFISDHGGNHNAYTAFSHTNYFFDIDPDYLHEGLKRFSRFFVAPLFSREYVDRELNAVDSEYQSKLREDGWRNFDTIKTAMNPAHPLAKFSIGNLQTLKKDNVREALLAFYQKYYAADRMSAVIIGKEPTETLLAWGKTLFADVPKPKTADTTINSPQFLPDDLPIVLKNQTIKNKKSLNVAFVLPFNLDDQYNKSLAFLSHTLGYEGQGSLLAMLKKLDYATDLYAGASERVGQEIEFEINILLTNKGYAQVKSVVALLFNYLQLLKQETAALAKTRYQEQAQIAKTEFDFREKRPSIDESSALASRLNIFPVKDVVAIGSIFSGYQHDRMQAILAHFVPQQAIVQISAPDGQFSDKTQYFSVPYQLEKKARAFFENITLTDEEKAALKAAHLPKPNPFVADDYRVKSTEVIEKAEKRERGVDLFFRHDAQFGTPRTHIYSVLQTAAPLSVTEKTALALFSAYINERLAATRYDADLAGVSLSLGSGETVINLALEGYQQRMPLLLQTVLEEMQAFSDVSKTASVDPLLFSQVKNKMREQLENSQKNMPYMQLLPYLRARITENVTLPEARLAAIAEIDERVMIKTMRQFFKKISITLLVYGNETWDFAQTVAGIFEKSYKDNDLSHKFALSAPRLLSQAETIRFDSHHADNAVLTYLQGDQGEAALAKTALLAQMIEPQFFSDLRTEKQLGYIVFAMPISTRFQAGLGFVVQSPVADNTALLGYIKGFTEKFAKNLANLKAADFEAAKAIQKAELLRKPENLAQAASEYWQDILLQGKAISHKRAQAQSLDSLTLADFLSYAQTLLATRKQADVLALPDTRLKASTVVDDKTKSSKE